MNVHIEGNIGAGKSTLLNYIQTNFGNNFKFNVSQEPVDQWMNLRDGENNILDKFYEDPKRWSFAFQMNCFITRTSKVNKLPSDELNFIERSIYSDKIFASNCFSNGMMNPIEMEIYSNWSNWLEFELCPKIDKIIYLRSTPEVSYDRIKQRSRTGESDISLEYLTQLHELHDQWLTSTDIPVLTIDADKLDYNNHEFYDVIYTNFFHH